MTDTTNQNQVVDRIKDRWMTATIFRNVSEKGKVYFRAEVTKAYKKSEDQYGYTTAFNADELLRAEKLTAKAYDRMLELEDELRNGEQQQHQATETQDREEIQAA